MELSTKHEELCTAVRANNAAAHKSVLDNSYQLDHKLQGILIQHKADMQGEFTTQIASSNSQIVVLKGDLISLVQSEMEHTNEMRVEHDELVERLNQLQQKHGLMDTKIHMNHEYSDASTKQHYEELQGRLVGVEGTQEKVNELEGMINQQQLTIRAQQIAMNSRRMSDFTQFDEEPAPDPEPEPVLDQSDIPPHQRRMSSFSNIKSKTTPLKTNNTQSPVKATPAVTPSVNIVPSRSRSRSPEKINPGTSTNINTNPNIRTDYVQSVQSTPVVEAEPEAEPESVATHEGRRMSNFCQFDEEPEPEPEPVEETGTATVYRSESIRPFSNFNTTTNTDTEVNIEADTNPSSEIVRPESPNVITVTKSNSSLRNIFNGVSFDEGEFENTGTDSGAGTGTGTDSSAATGLSGTSGSTISSTYVQSPMSNTMNTTNNTTTTPMARSQMDIVITDLSVFEETPSPVKSTRSVQSSPTKKESRRRGTVYYDVEDDENEEDIQSTPVTPVVPATPVTPVQVLMETPTSAPGTANNTPIAATTSATTSANVTPLKQDESVRSVPTLDMDDTDTGSGLDAAQTTTTNYYSPSVTPASNRGSAINEEDLNFEEDGVEVFSPFSPTPTKPDEAPDTLE